MDLLLTIGGIIYGTLLIAVAFIKTKITEPFRIDAFIIACPTEQTRLLNLVAGFSFAAYSIYSLMTG